MAQIKETQYGFKIEESIGYGGILYFNNMNIDDEVRIDIEDG